MGVVNKIGRRFQSQGVNTIDDIVDDQDYSLDVEMRYNLRKNNKNAENLAKMQKIIKDSGGRVSDTCFLEGQFSGLMLLRVHCKGSLIKKLVGLSGIAEIDLIPQNYEEKNV
jgi:hypothetical protein